MLRLSIDVSTIPYESVRRVFTADKKVLDIGDAELRLVQPLRISCELHRIDREVMVQGGMRAAVCLTCGRCAEEFVLPLNIALDAIYLPMHEASSERTQELEDDLIDVYTYGEQTIDLAEMVRDKLLLSLPLQPHCMAACQGVCPSCGANRNTVTCQCAEVRLGSPFELLKGLRLS